MLIVAPLHRHRTGTLPRAAGEVPTTTLGWRRSGRACFMIAVWILAAEAGRRDHGELLAARRLGKRGRAITSPAAAVIAHPS
jgi:hypothetical protein